MATFHPKLTLGEQLTHGRKLSNLNQFAKRSHFDAVSTVVDDDRNYLLMRAEEEEAKAAQSQHEAVKSAHLDLAAVYRRTALAHCPRSLPVDRTIHPLVADPPVREQS